MRAPPPSRLIEGGLPTEATVAQVLVSKYADHLPLYLCLSKIKSERIRGAIRRGLGGKEYALPCAMGARPYPRPSACASYYVASVRFQNPAQMCLA
jgi:hypothetical protein